MTSGRKSAQDRHGPLYVCEGAFDALAMLAEPTFLDEVDSWPAERREAWEEKAAVLEFENKLTRPEAERAAYEIIKVELTFINAYDIRELIICNSKMILEGMLL